MGLEALSSSQIIGLSEAIDDRTASLLVAGTGITLTYNDGAGTLTIANTGLGGSTGSTDNRILRSDGTGGATVQASAVTIDDSGNISGLGTVACGAITASGTTVIAQLGTDPAVVQVGTTGNSATSVNAFVGGYAAAAGASTIYYGQNVYWNGSSWIRPHAAGNTALLWMQAGAFYWNTAGVSGSGFGSTKMELSNAGNLAVNGAITATGLIRQTSSAGMEFPSTGYGPFHQASTTWRNLSNGVLSLRNFAETAGISLDVTTDGTLRVANRTNSSVGNLSVGAITASGIVNVGVYTVATLPSAASNAGALAQVTDSSVTTNGSTVAGGGSSRVPVFSDGTNWIVK